MQEVLDQLRLFHASAVIISTNIELRRDGLPYANQAQPTDSGAAVYFKLKGRNCVLACDRWDRVEDNIWAIGKHLEAMRGQDRWGVGTVEQAFAGYAALPAAAVSRQRPWVEVLNLPTMRGLPSKQVIEDAFRDLARKLHPDRPGGSHDAMAELTAARDEALEAIEAGGQP